LGLRHRSPHGASREPFAGIKSNSG
jgi:hypothetical protein